MQSEGTVQSFQPPARKSHAVANVRRNAFPFDNLKVATEDEVTSLRTWAYAVAEWRLIAHWIDGLWHIEVHGNVPQWLIAMYVNTGKPSA